MEVIRQGLGALQRNRGAFLLYFAITATFHGALLTVHLQIIEPRAQSFSAIVLMLIRLGSIVGVTAAYALAQCIAFSRIGRDIDRPLWKVAGDTEAIRKFYNLWFILMLVNVLVFQICDQVAATASNDSTSLMLLLLWLTTVSVLIPLGAAVMFQGRAGREEIGRAFETLTRQLPRTLLIVLLAYVITSVVLAIQSLVLPMWCLPIEWLIDSYGDCLIFSCTWVLCMYNRDEESEDTDLDF